jgi:tripartite-type tricarboxylate transporter receptor subunit TctC
MKPFTLALAACATLAALATGAAGQTYPSKTVSIVVPFPPGGSVDGVARLLANELSEKTGKSFIIENRAGGAGGVVGANTVVKSASDGYTLLLNASIHVVTPLINKNVPFNVVEDFTHVAHVAAGPLLISTHPSVPAKTLKEFFDLMKKDPDKYNLATSGAGSAGHLATEALKLQAGIDAEVVAYKGAGPALNDLIGGQIHLMADPMLSSLPHVKSGRLKALAVTSAKRTPLAPDVPTVAESGMAAFEMSSWYAVWGPKGLPADVSAYLSKNISEVVNSQRFKEKLAPFGFEPEFMDSAKLKSWVVDEMKRYDAIVKAAKIQVQ